MIDQSNNSVETTNTARLINRLEVQQRKRGRPCLPIGQAMSNAERCRRHRKRREDSEVTIDRCAYEELIDALSDLAEALDNAKRRGLAVGACSAQSRTAMIRNLADYTNAQTKRTKKRSNKART